MATSLSQSSDMAKFSYNRIAKDDASEPAPLRRQLVLSIYSLIDFISRS